MDATAGAVHGKRGITMEYGYIRVSSKEQNEARQLDALHKQGIEDKISIWINSRVRILTARNIKFFITN